MNNRFRFSPVQLTGFAALLRNELHVSVARITEALALKKLLFKDILTFSNLCYHNVFIEARCLL